MKKRGRPPFFWALAALIPQLVTSIGTAIGAAGTALGGLGTSIGTGIGTGLTAMGVPGGTAIGGGVGTALGAPGAAIGGLGGGIGGIGTALGGGAGLTGTGGLLAGSGATGAPSGIAGAASPGIGELLASPSAQMMGLGEGAVFTEAGAQISPAIAQGVAEASPEVAAAVKSVSAAGGVDFGALSDVLSQAGKAIPGEEQQPRDVDVTQVGLRPPQAQRSRMATGPSQPELPVGMKELLLRAALQKQLQGWTAGMLQ